MTYRPSMRPSLFHDNPQPGGLASSEFWRRYRLDQQTLDELPAPPNGSTLTITPGIKARARDFLDYRNRNATSQERSR